ncbi:ROK family glucokinase [Paenibacillus thiaminolyticus]|uniref:Glucokinase n=1 Tax=Paenibacillus thiaminolyticus TaxID=49283 RepID=A0AAJ1G1I0_PANTH|nr:ROK family glucokinase [Paenibacillus thiaminolyticus]MCY9537965.1 ROK family glucokinase [Paenibacillus thiaminolyticus]MCY9605375.1 ROK family glucokinase [Paenibacillus thiaminolyticus]MCY9606884.1 ROK family glucokinase [Paenibacillus thiaminolyticus]MCY9612687.1 ROK family glucokinase [Paenibacillus thiaminolyticus]MCY9620173.1 ROK family glucokinase [Paenibacillus thiaminolyticus]
MSEQIYVGVDLGGTAIKVGICDTEGRLLQTFEGPTEVAKGPDTVIDNIENYIRRIVEESPYDWSQVAGIGAGVAGFTNVKEGVILLAPNVGFKDVPIRAILEARLGKPVKIDNDANVAALGEAWSGAGKGIDNCVCYTLGTGVGGGIIINGKIVQGFSGMAGELGHIAVIPDLEAIQCGCGKMGCLETVSSATGIIRMAKDAVERGDRTSLSLLEDIAAKDVFDAAKAGDEVAVRIISRAAFYLGKSMAAVAVTLNPERFIIGGGLSKAGEFLFEQIRETFKKLSPEPVTRGVSIVPAELGNDAGMIGAAGLFLRS